MDYTKKPIDFATQLIMLKSRGLLIDDEVLAEEQLHSISYFRLANYLRPMEQDAATHIFKQNSHFEDAIKLYMFDKNLRVLVFNAIQDIEIALRTRVIHYFSMAHGAFWFMDATLFKDASIFANCLENIKVELKRSKEDFIQEHFAKYDNPQYPPSWKTMEVISFGTLSKLFCNFNDVKVKKAIARSFNLPQYTYLENWIKCAAVLRNCCAHHARIWNRRFPTIPKLPETLPADWICKKPQRPVKIYGQLCCLAYLEQSINPNGSFKTKLIELLSAYPHTDLRAMGFTKEWQSEAIWNV